jgi:hypothetical protein
MTTAICILILLLLLEELVAFFVIAVMETGVISLIFIGGIVAFLFLLWPITSAYHYLTTFLSSGTVENINSFLSFILTLFFLYIIIDWTAGWAITQRGIECVQKKLSKKIQTA